MLQLKQGMVMGDLKGARAVGGFEVGVFKAACGGFSQSG